MRRSFLRLVWTALARLVRGLFAHNAFDAAAAIAFWFFLSLVPLLVFAGWLLGQLVKSRGVDSLVDPLLGIVPGADAGDLLRREIERMAGAASAPIAPISVIGFLWTSSAGLHNLMDIFELAVKVPERPWWKQRAIALLWVVVGLATAIGTTWALVKIDTVIHDDGPVVAAAPTLEPLPTPAPSSREKVMRAEKPSGKRDVAKIRPRFAELLHAGWERTAALGVAVLVGVSILAGFYRYAVEHPTGVRRRTWPGAFVAAALWLLVSWAFGAYASSLGDYAMYYGGLAAVAVLLVWLYLSSLALFVGAEVNAQLEGVRE